MSTVKAYYNGSAFVPIEPFQMPKGEVVYLSIAQDDSSRSEAAERLMAFRQLTSEIHELNMSEPLPPEFDDILAKRVNFTRELDL